MINSVLHAIEGVLHVVRRERNARIHLVVALVVLGLGFGFGMPGRDLAAIVLASLVVFLAEITNTALEKTLDLIDDKPREEVKVVKDMAAGGVLVAALIAAVICAVVFKPYVLEWWWRVR